MAVCRVFCGSDPGTVWPKPTGPTKLSNIVATINPATLVLRASNFKIHEEFWTENKKRFLEQITAKLPKSIKLNDGKQLIVNIDVTKLDDILTLETDESYRIHAAELDGNIVVTIEATTIFGARHGLETLSQLIVFDDIRNELQIVGEFSIQDAPKFKHRGLLLDTARNYFSVESIKRTIG